jgi:predicted nucleic acid-binding protein
LGRWSSYDPLYLRDSTNVYTYALNNPIVAKDPTGGPAWLIPVAIYLGYKALASAGETAVEAGIAQATGDDKFSVGGTFLKNMVVNSTIGLIPGTSEAKITVKAAVYTGKLALRTTADATLDTVQGKGDFTENFVKSGAGNVGGDLVGAAFKKGGSLVVNKLKGSTDEAAEAASKQATQKVANQGIGGANNVVNNTPVVSSSASTAVKASVKATSKQLDANLISALLNPKDVGHASAVAFVSANKAGNLTINRHTYMKILSRYSKDQFNELKQLYGIKLLKEINLPELGATASKLEKAFAGTGRAISAEDARVAATGFLRNETVATADLQFFKRARDLGLSVEFIGSGNTAKKATAYIPQPVAIPAK